MFSKILLAGDGGQGIQLIADMLAQTAFRKGLFVSQLPNYGLEQRGGVSLSFLQISDQAISYPKFTKPDILLVMSEQARARTREYVAEGVEVVDIHSVESKIKELGIKEQSYNIFFLGYLGDILNKKGFFGREEIFPVLKEKLEKKNGWEENQKAFLA